MFLQKPNHPYTQDTQWQPEAKAAIRGFVFGNPGESW